MKTQILSFAFGILCSAACAQSFSGSTLTWTADRAVNVEQSDTVEMKCSFKTISQTEFQWSQRNGTINSTYQVTSVDGSWADVSQIGTITLSLQRNGKSSKAILERTSEGVFVTMDFSVPGTPTHVRFRIVKVN